VRGVSVTTSEGGSALALVSVLPFAAGDGEAIPSFFDSVPVIVEGLGILLGGVTATYPSSSPRPGLPPPFEAASMTKPLPVPDFPTLLLLNQSMTFLAGPVEAEVEVERLERVPEGSRLFGLTEEDDMEALRFSRFRDEDEGVGRGRETDVRGFEEDLLEVSQVAITKSADFHCREGKT
jgi:hypothetical protein